MCIVVPREFRHLAFIAEANLAQLPVAAGVILFHNSAIGFNPAAFRAAILLVVGLLFELHLTFFSGTNHIITSRQAGISKIGRSITPGLGSLPSRVFVSFTYPFQHVSKTGQPLQAGEDFVNGLVGNFLSFAFL